MSDEDLVQVFDMRRLVRAGVPLPRKDAEEVVGYLMACEGARPGDLMILALKAEGT